MIKSSQQHLHRKKKQIAGSHQPVQLLQSQRALKGEVKNIYPCNAMFCWKPLVRFADQAQGRAPPPPAGQHTWPNHKNCSGMCEEHDEDLKALNSPPNSPDPNLMAHVCRNEFDSWRPPPHSPQDPESMSWFYTPKNIPRGPVSVPRKVGASLVTQHEPCGFTILYCCNGFH